MWRLPDAAARRFPLVARPRPACLPLHQRIQALTRLADVAAEQGDPSIASTVLNRAALIASDIGDDTAAGAMCHQHAAAYLHATPLPADAAIRALEPLVNLARLQLRAGRADQGRQYLLTLFDAVARAAPTDIEGIAVPADLVADTADRHTVRAWLWSVLLADGTRALTTVGRWTEALAHVQTHHGIGRRMLDGRQTAVLAAATTGDRPAVLALLHDTEPGDPWEDAVTAALTALCRPGDRRAAARAAGLWTVLEPGDGLAVFTTRLALTVLDATEPDTPAARNLARTAIIRTDESGDGYALRDLLAHPAARAVLAAERAEARERALAACALGSGTLPADSRERLDAAVGGAVRVLENALAAPGERRPPAPRAPDPGIRQALKR
ncbi:MULTISPECIES: hypothetical protein [Kitasatospora]|uniref:Uncharacterized protein n=1 Tax=Kitasatospora setae (strain ATCC 33774 / DSM 43861 / JCM 3304 / KCC A-0304 / NBRC 14216 / KM-6054) TaxID=452652 RepID=E4N0H1_KITSK|nr:MULTISPECIES: hypothetical protein [Kitasatospora]BAJ31655.1 hypothetical protein KSE_58850 [Kitasatospora setae KM-6054]